MLCPYCSNEMKKGVIQCRDGLWWTEKPRPIAALPVLGGQRMELGSRESGPFRGSAATAFFCEDCKKIIMDCAE